MSVYPSCFAISRLDSASVTFSVTVASVRQLGVKTPRRSSDTGCTDEFFVTVSFPVDGWLKSGIASLKRRTSFEFIVWIPQFYCYFPGILECPVRANVSRWFLLIMRNRGHLVPIYRVLVFICTKSIRYFRDESDKCRWHQIFDLLPVWTKNEYRSPIFEICYVWLCFYLMFSLAQQMLIIKFLSPSNPTVIPFEHHQLPGFRAYQLRVCGSGDLFGSIWS